MLAPLLALALLLLVAPASHASEQRVLVMGGIHDDPTTLRARLAPMAAYVREQLGLDAVHVVTARNRDEMIALLRYGRVDWVSETVFNAVAIEQSGQASIVARTWRNGWPTYRTKFFVSRDSDIESLNDLVGAKIAFEQAGSTSAFFVPAMELVNRSLPLCRLQHPRDDQASDCIGFAFSGRSFNTAAWVHKSIVDVGVFSNVDWEADEKLPAGFKRDFRVFHETDPIPRSVEMLRAGLDETLRERLVALLMEIHGDPAAEQALGAYYQTRKFDTLSQDDDEALDRLRAALPLFDRSVH